MCEQSNAYKAYDALSTTTLYPTLTIDDLLSIIEQIHCDIRTRAEDLTSADAVYYCDNCNSTNIAVFDDSVKVNDVGMVVAVEVSDIGYIRKCKDCGNELERWRELDGERMDW